MVPFSRQKGNSRRKLMAGAPPAPTGTSTNQPTIDGGTSSLNASPVGDSLGGKDGGIDVVLNIKGTIAAGGPLSQPTIVAVNAAARKTPHKFRLYIAYEGEVKVGGSLAWRANNPGNLRDAPTKISSVPGAVGHFAVFASMEEGRSAQRDLYIKKYGKMTVKDAVNNLTPPSENDTTKYLADLKAAGVDIDKDVASQIDLLMSAIQANEGMIEGTVVERAP
jgi:hypothetical protein